MLLDDVQRPQGKPDGLRGKKRKALMRHVQGVAIDLFDERGFEQVTVEEVAAAAEVSPSSVYRHFHTKEGLILHDEYDDEFFRALLDHLQHHDLRTSVLRTIDQASPDHLTVDLDSLVRRTRYMLECRPVRTATLELVHELTELIIATVTTTEGPARMDPFDARVVCSAVVWGIYHGLVEWYVRGANEPMDVALRRAVDLLLPADRYGP